jgi:small subunit ribosomal protein S13
MFKNLNIQKNQNKKVYILLCKIFGITLKKALYICNLIGITKNTLLKNISKDIIETIDSLLLQNFLSEHDLKNKQYLQIKKIIELNSYRGKCHLYGYPVRGQRTHSNSRTQKKKLLKH